jgi:hypothetical protein
MGKERVQTRADPDVKTRIEEYADDREIGQAEAVRRLIDEGLDAKGYPVDPEVVADGGAVVRPLLRTMTAVACVIGILAVAGAFLAAEAGAGALGVEFLSMTVAAFLTAATAFLPLVTTVPERIDERLWSASRRVRRRVSA